MSPSASRLRLATLAAVALALVLSGVVAGAAGDPFIIGQTNDSGMSQSILLNAGLGAAFTLKTTNVSTGATGIFGWSSNTGANATRGVYGKADGPNSYGVFGRQSGATGSGAAVYGEGNANSGVVGTTTGGTGYGVAGVNGANQGVAVYALAGGISGRGVHGLSTGSSGIGVFGESAGFNGFGVYGWSNGPSGTNYGVYGRVESASGYGVQSDGDLQVIGDLFATGSKTGYVADVALNGSAVTLHQGDAVTLIGVRPAVLGTIPLLVVGPARAGDPIIGVVDRLAEVATAARPNGLPGTVPAIHGRGTTVPAGAHLLVVTLGAFAVASADASAGPIAVGDELTVGPRPGRLARAKGTERTVGYALGALADGSGRIGIFVSPH